MCGCMPRQITVSLRRIQSIQSLLAPFQFSSNPILDIIQSTHSKLSRIFEANPNPIYSSCSSDPIMHISKSDPMKISSDPKIIRSADLKIRSEIFLSESDPNAIRIGSASIRSALLCSGATRKGSNYAYF